MPNTWPAARAGSPSRAVVIALMVGTGVLMASIAFSFQRYFEVQVEEGLKISQ